MDSLPSEVARARAPVLAKMLGHLPDEMLSALAYGLERHRGRLAAGRLYADPDGGGCAVGVMLRELTPSAYRQGRLQFLLRRHRHRSILSEQVELERPLVVRLSHLEMCFDNTTMEIRQHAPEAGPAMAANATGRWIAESCREELRVRSRGGHSGFFVPHEWQTPQALRRARQACRLGHVARVPHVPTNTRRMIDGDGTVKLVTLPARHVAADDAPRSRAGSGHLVLAA